jgi:hypothetical protein
MQDHASAIFQRDELTDREALGTRVGDEWRREIADGANAYNATWLDTGKLARVHGARVRTPTTFHATHFLPSSEATRDCLWYVLSPPRRTGHRLRRDSNSAAHHATEDCSAESNGTVH